MTSVRGTAHRPSRAAYRGSKSAAKRSPHSASATQSGRARDASPGHPPWPRLIVGAGIGASWACVGAGIGSGVRSCRPRSIRVVIAAIRLRAGLGAHRLALLNHDDLRSDRSAIVEIDDVVIEQAYAAARHLLADRLRLDGSMEAKIGVLIAAVEIKRARAERIVDAARQPGRVMRVNRHAANHVPGRRPVRPFGLSAYDGVTAEVQRLLAADAHAVAHRHAARLDEIEMPFTDHDDDRAWPIGAGEGDLLAKQAGIDGAQIERGDFVPMVIDRTIGGEIGVPKRVEGGPKQSPALACATPEQDRDSRKDAASVDTRGHCANI